MARLVTKAIYRLAFNSVQVAINTAYKVIEAYGLSSVKYQLALGCSLTILGTVARPKSEDLVV